MPNCPECGKFMKLIPFEQAGRDVWDSFLWWWCFDEERKHTYEIEPIPAREYQWLWDCEGIPAEDLIADPDLFAEYKTQWDALPKTMKRQYTNQSPEAVQKTRRASG